jgi:hypothetical protein
MVFVRFVCTQFCEEESADEGRGEVTIVVGGEK